MPHAGFRILTLCAALACPAAAGFAQHQSSKPGASLPAPTGGRREDHAVRLEVPEVVYVKSVLDRINYRIARLRAPLDTGWRQESLTSTPDGAFEAFTIEQPICQTRVGTSVKDRIFFAQRKTGRVYEILGLPEGHRPFMYLRWGGDRLLIFDRWASPHHGVRYKLDPRRRRLISARAFVEAEYIEFLKKTPR